MTSEQDDLRDALEQSKQASRGYADFDSWPDDETRDLGIGWDFATAVRQLGVDISALRATGRGSDPPDLIANESIGIELSEFVDQELVAAGRRARRSGERVALYRDWSADQLIQQLSRIVSRKDAAVPKTVLEWQGYWLVIHTDEPGLTPELIAAHLTHWSPPQCRLLTRAFLLMSYFPEKGRPLFELQLIHVAA